VQELIGEMTGWVSDHGVDEETARLLVAQMTRAAATTVRERPDDSIRDLVDELATPRSFTLKGLEVLRGSQAFTPWKNAAAALFEKG
jgi:pyrroline-5-carboxylate reductase